MARVTVRLFGPDGRQYQADPRALERALKGTGSRRVRVYDVDRPARGRPAAKFRVGDLRVPQWWDEEAFDTV